VLRTQVATEFPRALDDFLLKFDLAWSKVALIKLEIKSVGDLELLTDEVRPLACFC
jgi:hypothetical protein